MSLAAMNPIPLDPNDPEFALDPKGDDSTLRRVVVRYYQRCLATSERAQRFLVEHAISAEAAQRFQLGYSDRSLGAKIPNKLYKVGKCLRNQLTKLGLMRSTGHEHFRHCIVVPVFAADGSLVSVYARWKRRSNIRPLNRGLSPVVAE
jgi:DNA primase